MSIAGVRVLEMAGLGPAPLAAAILADLGAEIIRVDRARDPGAGEVRETLHAMLRGRRSIGIDLHKEAGTAVLLRLVEDCDVLIEPFRPGVMERLGIGPEVCLARNPNLLFVRMTGYGQDGPLASKAGHDINYLALAGVLAHLGPPGAPPPPPLSLVGDFGGGTMFLLVAVLAGLLEVRAGGTGQVIDVAMTDGAATLMSLFYDGLASGTWQPERGRNRLDGSAPFYRCYETEDGRFIAVGANERRFYRQLLQGLEFDEVDLPDQHDTRRWPELAKLFAERFRTRTRDEWVRRFEGLDACVAPVLTMVEAPHHPHNRARAAFRRVGDVEHYPAAAPRIPSVATPEYTRVGAPGADTARVLAGFGFAPDEIAALAACGAVAGPQPRPAQPRPAQLRPAQPRPDAAS